MSGRLQRLPRGVGFLPLVVGLLVWQILAAGGDSPFFPPPSDWYTAIVDDHGWQTLVDLTVTLKVWIIGLAIASAVGSVLGVMIGFSFVLYRMLSPVIEFLRVLPSPVILPVAALALGQGQQTQIFLVAFASVWPVLLNTVVAARGIEPVLREVARTLGLSRPQAIRKIILPHTVPAIVVGIRVAAPIALILTILAEMLAPNAGIGARLTEAQVAYRAADAFGLLVVVGIFGYALNSAINAAEGLVLRRWPKGVAA